MGADFNIPTLTAASANKEFALGAEALFQGTRYRYIKAAAAIALGDALIIDTAQADEPNLLIPSSAVNQSVAGVATYAIPINNYGWVVVRGKVPSAKVAAATAAGAQLGTSAVAGTLSTIAIAGAYAQAEVQRVLAAAAGLGVQAMDVEAGGLAELFVHG